MLTVNLVMPSLLLMMPGVQLWRLQCSLLCCSRHVFD